MCMMLYACLGARVPVGHPSALSVEICRCNLSLSLPLSLPLLLLSLPMSLLMLSSWSLVPMLPSLLVSLIPFSLCVPSVFGCQTLFVSSALIVFTSQKTHRQTYLRKDRCKHTRCDTTNHHGHITIQTNKPNNPTNLKTKRDVFGMCCSTTTESRAAYRSKEDSCTWSLPVSLIEQPT
ncbi:hypothetical protein BKA57DRAFT_239025 [Linnemannia elongata]|nr:hypothetical protein BKA57DRAFT_239025 [Linnemannia elongata]